jgi:two-component system, response regulator
VAAADSGVDILMVEDNPDDEQLTLRAFAKNHLTNKIHVVRDGQEALDYIFCKGKYADRNIADHPHVILLDIKLPLIDGIEVLRRIKADERTKTIPVVMLTSSHEERDLVETYRLGVNSYIVKPVDFEQFTDSARSLGMYWLLLNRPPKAA